VKLKSKFVNNTICNKIPVNLEEKNFDACNDPLKLDDYSYSKPAKTKLIHIYNTACIFDKKVQF
jgi:hypothetical protein